MRRFFATLVDVKHEVSLAYKMTDILSRAHIKAVIQNRSLWKDEHERLLPGHDGNSNLVYDEAGTVHCYDRVSEPMVRHPMAYIGYEPQRETIKYRCPAMHQGWPCPMSATCNQGKTYGLTVRISRESDLRRFPALPRATKKFERLYTCECKSELDGTTGNSRWRGSACTTSECQEGSTNDEAVTVTVAQFRSDACHTGT